MLINMIAKTPGLSKARRLFFLLSYAYLAFEPDGLPFEEPWLLPVGAGDCGWA